MDKIIEKSYQNMKNLHRYRLMTPGPTPVPEEAQLALARDVRHHRTEAFRNIFREAQKSLQNIFCTQNEIAILSGSGTAAMEACVVNAVPRGGTALVLSSGKFAHRWAQLCERFHIRTILYEVPWGKAFSAERVRELLHTHPEIEAVYATLCETSTGVGHDIKNIGKVVAATNALLVVDGISGVGGMECRTDDWGIDLLAVGSQKALMTPPGLAFVAVSAKAWEKRDSFLEQPPAFYLDLHSYRRSAQSGDTPFTPSRSLIEALLESLRRLQEIGIENVWRQTAQLAEAVRSAVSAMGLTLFAERPCDVLTLIQIPDCVSVPQLLQSMEEDFGIKIAAAQGPLKGKAIRIAHMGMIDPLDIVGALAALELLLLRQQFPIVPGAGLKAFQETRYNQWRSQGG